MRSTAPLWKFGEVNPSSTEFKELAESTVVSFMPLEAVWPGGRADYTGRLAWSSKQSYTQFCKGDILVPKITPTFEAGRTIIAEIDTQLGLASTEVHVVRTRDNADARFLQYCFQSQPFLDEGASALQGVGNLRRITPRFVQELRVLDVDRDSQQRIADYLDRETGEIDAMIAKMDELAGTLESRRIESITSAVTGATSADRVHTGNVWFPTVPRGWRTSSVQLLSARLTDGAHISPETENGEYDFVSTRDVRNGVIDFEGSLKTSASSYEYLVRTGCRPSDGDILFSKDGTVGETAIVEGAPEFVVASSLIIVTPMRSLVIPEFLRYALESGPAQRAARSYTRGSGLPRISVVNFGRGVVVPVPPTLDEQKSIADHLDEVTGKIDAMLTKTAELKSLLTERRAALITDVVTGRKDVA